MGSPKICIVLLAPFEYVLGPPGPIPKDTPIVKLKARTAQEFRQHLYDAGYPTEPQKKELEKAYQVKALKEWEAECDFIEFMNNGRVNKKPLPKKPTFK